MNTKSDIYVYSVNIHTFPYTYFLDYDIIS